MVAILNVVNNFSARTRRGLLKMKIVIIDGSIRDGKASSRIAKWVHKAASETLQNVDLEVVDLKELNLPQFAEPMPPLANKERNPQGSLKVWLDTLASADGFVFITPEYNHGMPGGLKNAIDLIDHQVMRKPFMLVGHGGVGGARAIAQLKTVLNANIGAVPIPNSVNVIGYVGHTNDIDENGNATTEATKQLSGPLAGGLEALAWYTAALKAAREE